MSKKVKGQKVHLAAFIGNSASEAALPSAPNPNRDPNDYGRRRRDGPNDRVGGRGDRMDGGRGGGVGGDFRGSNSDSWGRDTMSRRRDGEGGENNMSDEPWQRRTSSNADGGGFGMGSLNRHNIRESNEPPTSRPEHLRIKLEPRSLPLPAASTDTGESSIPPQASVSEQRDGDKWSKAFNKGSTVSSSVRDEDSRYRRGGDWTNAVDGRENASRNSWGDRVGGRGGEPFATGISSGSWSNLSKPRGSGYQGGRGSYGSTREDESIDDPRFSKFFANPSAINQSSDRHRVADAQGTENSHMGSLVQDHSVHSSDGTKNVDSAKTSDVIPVAKSSEVDAAVKVSAARAVKEAKTAARLEKERLEKERKEASALKEKEIAELARQANELALQNASNVFQTGAKGADLKSVIEGLDEDKRPSGSALMSVVLEGQFDIAPLKWCTDAEYGTSLKFLLAGNPNGQVEALYAVQMFCSKRSFPKIEIKDKPRKLVQLIFQLLYQCGIIEASSFTTWSEDDRDDVPGKKSALFQTGEFFLSLQEGDEGDEGDDEEEYEEIDAPREIVK